MEPRLNPPAQPAPRPGPAEIADTLDRERRLDRLGAAFTTVRVFLVLVVQAYLLLGFALLFVRPPAAAFYVAILVLAINSLLAAGALAWALRLRRQMRQLLAPSANRPAVPLSPP